jgi:hypothetical protein
LERGLRKGRRPEEAREPGEGSRDVDDFDEAARPSKADIHAKAAYSSGMSRVGFSRIAVLGCSGSGKSTLAAKLASDLDLPFFPTDDVYWRANWTPAPASEVEAWLDATTASSCWVLDGNFDGQRDILWARADLAVWLDLLWLTTVSAVFSETSVGGSAGSQSGAASA